MRVLRLRGRAVALFLFLLFSSTAEAQYLPTSPGAAPDMRLRFTHVFTQYNFYTTESDKRSLHYRYRSNGFSTGVNFRYGPSVSGYVFGGYTRGVDDISAPVASRSDYDLPQFGGLLRYSWNTNFAIGGSLVVQRIDGDFSSATVSGSKDGWGVAGGGFVQFSFPVAYLWVDITPALNANNNRVTQPGPSSSFSGGGTTTSLGVSMRYSMTRDWTVGVGVTPTWVLSESSGLTDRATGPFYVTFSGQTRFRLNGPLWMYGSYNYAMHGSERSAHSAVVGLSWAIGP
jgi:hypothetical protein